jgi:uncharacterized alkaline shock family protein YloU
MNGQIVVSEGALASLIGLTAHEIPGVVGMAPTNIREGIQRVLGRAQAREGVTLTRDGEGYCADLYVVVAYGVSIPTVAQNIAEKVERNVKSQAGVTLTRTRVHAVGVAHGE